MTLLPLTITTPFSWVVVGVDGHVLEGVVLGQPSCEASSATSQAVPRAIHHGYPACTARQTAILISHWAHLYIFIRYSLHSFVYLYKVLISMTYFYLQKQLTHLYIFIRYSFPWYTFLFKNNLAYWSQFFRCKYFRCTPFSTLCAATKHYIENNSTYCIFRDKCKLPQKVRVCFLFQHSFQPFQL